MTSLSELSTMHGGSCLFIVNRIECDTNSVNVHTKRWGNVGLQSLENTTNGESK